MVYKEYKPGISTSLSVNALRAMPEFLESLPYRDGAKLISLTAWPCALVEDAGQVSGFIMPAIPDEFFTDFWTSNKPTPSTVMAEFQHLLNEPSVLSARFGGAIISERQKYELLRQAALALLFFHEHGICVGDISPKNLLFSLDPAPAVYFVDCDAMRVNGVSLSGQMETPGWGVPTGEELATIYTDTYKLGLLAVRLILGSQDAKNPKDLPLTVPAELRQVIASTLAPHPRQRPSLELWERALDAAIAATPQQAPPPPPPPAPQPPPPSAPPPSAPQPPTLSPPPASPKRRVAAWLLVPAAVVALIAIVAVASRQGVDTKSTASYATTTVTVVTETSVTTVKAAAPTTPAGPWGPWGTPTSRTQPPVDPEAAAEARLRQIAEADRSDVQTYLADWWVPQLSSKRPGVKDDGVVWDNVRTLQEYLELKNTFGAVLLWSGDWSTFDASNFWVTVAPARFNTPEGALQWCASHGRDSWHCFAKLVSTTHPIDGSTVIK